MKAAPGDLVWMDSDGYLVSRFEIESWQRTPISSKIEVDQNDIGIVICLLKSDAHGAGNDIAYFVFPQGMGWRWTEHMSTFY